MQVAGLVSLNILEPVADATTYPDVAWPLMQPPPALKRTGADVPAPGEVPLVEVLGSHGRVLQTRTIRAGDFACLRRGEPGTSWVPLRGD